MGALLDGFRTGYDRMDQYYQQEENKRRYEQQQQADNDRYNRGLQRQQAMDDMAKQSHAAQMANSALQQKINQNQVDRLPQQNAYTDEIQVINKQSASLNNQTNQFKLNNDKKDRTEQEAFEKLNYLYASGNAGEKIYDPEFDNTNIALMRDGGGDIAEGIVSKWKQGLFKESIADVNRLFSSQLNKGTGAKGRNGGQIKDKEIANLRLVKDENGEDALEFDLKITTDKETYTAPLSKYRSTHPDDPISQISLDKIYKTVGSMAQLNQLMKQSGTYDKSGKNVSALMQSSNPQKPQQVPAQAQNVQYMAQAMGIPEGEAWQIMVSAKENPQQLQLAKAEFIQRTLKDYRDAQEATMEPVEKEAIQKIMQESSSLFDQIIGSTNQQSALQTGGTAQTNQVNPKLAAILQQAKAAIDAGIDKNAVIQRLVEMGVPQDQINL